MLHAQLPASPVLAVLEWARTFILRLDRSAPMLPGASVAVVEAVVLWRETAHSTTAVETAHSSRQEISHYCNHTVSKIPV